MLLNSIRWRLQLWHGLLLVLVLAGFGATAYQLQSSNQLRRIDQELQHRISVIASVMRRPGEGPGRFPPRGRLPGGEFPPEGRDQAGGEDPPGGRPFTPEGDNVPPGPPHPIGPGGPAGGPPLPRELRLSARDLNLFEGSTNDAFYYIVWTRDGRLLWHSDSAPQEVSRPAKSSLPNETRMRGKVREMYHYNPVGDCILTGRDIGRELGDMQRNAGLLLCAGGVVLVFGLAGGWWLSSRAIRPIKKITATASSISSGDLSKRVPIADTDNELDQLATVLNSTFARLEAAFIQQARFTSDAAHELRTPVSVMLTQTQAALARERPAAEYRQAVEACQRAAQRMRRLIESLLELARLDSAQEPMKREQIDLAKVAAECLELVRPLAAQRNLEIETNLPATECVGDSERLSLVVTNLLVNAVHYNREGGRIYVIAEKNNGNAILSIRDEGQGIKTEDLPHIFERFWRADKSRSRAQGRTGLGLAIAKSIVEAHGGVIEAESRPEEGSTFRVRIPCLMSNV